MDNNPERRASESSEDEEKYVLAPETCDDDSDDDTYAWFDACEEPQAVSIEPENSQIKKEREKSMNQGPSQENQLLGSPQEKSKNSTPKSSKKCVLHTDIDSGQQRSSVQAEQVRYEQTQRVTGDEIDVTFHALVSNDIYFQADTDRVFLYLWDGLYTENQGTVKEMKFVCYRPDAKNAVEIMGTVTFRKSRRLLGQKSYQYYIERHSIDPVTRKPRGHLWEKVYTHSTCKRRVLCCSYSKNVQETQWHQYDGYIYEHLQKGMFESVIGALSLLNKDEDAGLVSRIFAKDIIKTLLRNAPTSNDISQALTKSLCLIICIESTYMIHNKVVKKALWDVYTNMLKNLIDFNDDLSVHRKVAMCILMLKLCHLAPVEFSNTQAELICKSFLLMVDRKLKTTVEWRYIEQYISVEDRYILKNNLGILALNIARSYSRGKNPFWFYLLPMLHFLDGTCQPFEEISFDTNHRGSKPVWWGISPEIEFVITNFKSVVGVKWNTTLRQVSENMQYMFEADFYLPRTILSSLTLEELKDALDTNVFPPEICCACITYFIHTQSRSQNRIEKCIDSLLQHIESTSLGGYVQFTTLMAYQLKRLQSKWFRLDKHHLHRKS